MLQIVHMIKHEFNLLMIQSSLCQNITTVDIIHKANVI